MYKKTLLVTAILLSGTSVALANGFYAGAGFGILTNTTPHMQQTALVNAPSNFRGAPVNLFAGFGGLVYQCIYLAGELTGTVVTAEFADNKGLKTSYGYGASVLPGLMVNDRTLVFARGGMVGTRFSDANTTETGGQAGLGAQISVTPNVDVRGEYDYTWYNSFNNKYGKISSPSSDAFNLSLLYKFE